MGFHGHGMFEVSNAIYFLVGVYTLILRGDARLPNKCAKQVHK